MNFGKDACDIFNCVWRFELSAPGFYVIVNSVMLTTADASDVDRIGEEQEAEFLTTEQVSSSVYATAAQSR